MFSPSLCVSALLTPSLICLPQFSSFQRHCKPCESLFPPTVYIPRHQWPFRFHQTNSDEAVTRLTVISLVIHMQRSWDGTINCDNLQADATAVTEHLHPMWACASCLLLADSRLKLLNKTITTHTHICVCVAHLESPAPTSVCLKLESYWCDHADLHTITPFVGNSHQLI